MWWHWCRRRRRERTGAGKWAGQAMALSLPSMIGVVVVVTSGQGANGWARIQQPHVHVRARAIVVWACHPEAPAVVGIVVAVVWWHRRRRHREQAGTNGVGHLLSMTLSLSSRAGAPAIDGVVVAVVWWHHRRHRREWAGTNGVGTSRCCCPLSLSCSGIAIVAMVMLLLLSLRGGASVVDGIVVVASGQGQTAGGREWVGWMASTNGTWLCALGCDKGRGHVVIYLTGVSAIVVLWSNVASSTAGSNT
ncbi:hypothetical protein EV363DRAFT_1296610 [Boletus edulis]|nr:hypothetical protein EV363DRAFT_1296610 [Boletus edulis]